MKYLLDTNVLSEARHPNGEPRVKEWLWSIEGESAFVSVISIGEIASGAALLDNPRRARELRAWLQAIRSLYASRILPVDADVAETWGDITAAAKRQGRTLPPPDGLIAATARIHGLRVATRNVRHMLEAGVGAFDPWTGAVHEPSA